MQYCALASIYFKQNEYNGILFKNPHKKDYNNLLCDIINVIDDDDNKNKINIIQISLDKLRQRSTNEREAFELTDNGGNLAINLDEANYCIKCHNQAKDSCSSGLPDKVNGGYKKSLLGNTLAGCPLEVPISEFHTANSMGMPIAALAIIMSENPLLSGTGDRICNDCMSSCIYQKQTPVNTPLSESQTLKAVLSLPWGFEVFSLLSRLNPANLDTPYPKAATQKKVLVVGAGPAGYTLAHYLLNDGHSVVLIDGLKVEPLSKAMGEFAPIKDINSLSENLNSRTAYGFGGVSEYGITVRWNKNFLTATRLLLERRNEFSLIGGVRFGGESECQSSSISMQQAFEMGFDHIALAMGAGKPTTLDIPNAMANGVRTASDFLMTLQSGNAAQKDSLTNLQVRLPIVVVGGGLTAIDTATESLAYYVAQVEKFASRYDSLKVKNAKIKSDILQYSKQEQEIADEFLEHARIIKKERDLAKQQNREPNIIALLQKWGGATIAYRKSIINSPAYSLNHEEVQKALEEGIFIATELTPSSIDVDEYARANSISFKNSSGETISLKAKSIFVAAGTSPNTVIAREDEYTYKMDGKYFQAINEHGEHVKPDYSNSKTNQVNIFLHKTPDNKFISFFGDLHPSYFGNVVKAMSSAKKGYPKITSILKQQFSNNQNNQSNQNIISVIQEGLSAKIHDVIRLTPNIVEIVIKAPFAAKNFRPGQFYRLQNFSAYAPIINNTKLAAEPLAMTGAWVDKELGLVGCIALEMGGSSNLCTIFEPGMPVSFMGPTGTPTHIQSNETVMLVGGGLGNAVLFSIGAAFRAAGSKVLYFAGYKKMIDRYKVAEIEAAADIIVWCCDEAPGFAINPDRPHDRTFVGNIVEAIYNYTKGNLDNLDNNSSKINTLDVDRIIAIGSDRMMAAVAIARHNILKPYLKTQHFAIGSINSPMQCMMKEICAQCLQPHKKLDGTIEYVFSCFNQDQDLDKVDFDGLNSRLQQNSTQEKLTKAWIADCINS
jgi:NADPH-dependent glutamate synthase beta subunit-like oxidoreductase/NAD(P)H-flavin reductase